MIDIKAAPGGDAGSSPAQLLTLAEQTPAGTEQITLLERVHETLRQQLAAASRD